MTDSVTRTPGVRASPSGVGLRAVVRDLAAAAPIVGVSTAPTWWLLGRSASHLALVGLLYGLLVWSLARWLPRDAPGPGIGAANRVTLLRAALVLPVLALALQPVALGAGGYWWVIVLSTVAMVLDGVDGRVARRTGTETSFGARFDMELDAVLILALSVLVWASGKAGGWVLVVGLMRYGFVAGAWVVPALGRPLSESFRRKAVCVVQGVALLVALGPIIPSPMASLVCAAALAALTWSFAVDVRWLLRPRP